MKLFTVALYLLAYGSVIVTAHIDGYASLLKEVTRENGLFEWLSVFFLLSIMLYGIRFAVKNRTLLPKRQLVAIVAFSIVAFFGAMEEISWGQQLFHFQTTEYFAAHNYQKETNLHNLVPAEIFSSVIYSSIYLFFVYLPLFAKLFFDRLTLIKKITPYLPSPHITLTILFAASFQAYLYDDFGAYVDMISQFAATALFGAMLYSGKIDRGYLTHYLWVVFTIASFLLSYRVFGFFNMQYEIREAISVFAILLYFTELTSTLRRKAISKAS